MKYIILIIIFLILIALSIGIYFLIKSQYKKIKTLKFETLDNLITYDVFNDFLNYIHQYKNNQKYALVIISMDGFSQVKTYLEEELITTYLNEIGHIIKIHLKKNWKFCQSSERDAFLIYVPITEGIDYQKIINEMFEALKLKKITLGDIEIQRTFSLAHVTYPNQANNTNELMSRLFATLLMIKKKGGNQKATFESFNYESENNYNKYLNVKQMIIENNFEFNYVPLRDHKKQILGLEINLFNKNKNKKETYDEFIATLETTNDAYWFSNWLFERVIEETFELLSTFESRSFMILIPCSVQQLMHDEIIKTLSNIVKKYKINPSRITLDILHTNTSYESYKLLMNINELKKLGFKLSTILNDKVIGELKYQCPLNFIEINFENINSKREELNNEFNGIQKIIRNVDVEDFNNLDINNIYLIKDKKEKSYKVKSLIKLINDSLDK